MITKLLTVVAMIVPFSNDAYAADAVSLFVTELLRTRAGEVWFVPGRLKDTVPKGGYLLRFELDLNNDGEGEIFVATSLDVDRKGEVWTGFKNNGSDYIKVTDDLFLGGDLRMKVENGIRKYSFYVPQKQTEGGSYLGFFWLDASGVWHEETRTLTDSEQVTMDGGDPDTRGPEGQSDEQLIADKLNLGSPVTISIKKALLAKYSQNPATPWRDVKKDFTLAQQYKDPADAEDIASVADWQPPASP